MNQNAKVATRLQRHFAQRHTIDHAKRVVGNKYQRAFLWDFCYLLGVKTGLDIGRSKSGIEKVLNRKRLALQLAINRFNFSPPEHDFNTGYELSYKPWIVRLHVRNPRIIAHIGLELRVESGLAHMGNLALGGSVEITRMYSYPTIKC